MWPSSFALLCIIHVATLNQEVYCDSTGQKNQLYRVDPRHHLAHVIPTPVVDCTHVVTFACVHALKTANNVPAHDTTTADAAASAATVAAVASNFVNATAPAAASAASAKQSRSLELNVRHKSSAITQTSNMQPLVFSKASLITE